MNRDDTMLDLIEIERELARFLAQQEYGLVDLQVASTGRGRTFRVFVERGEGSPADLADCARLTPMVTLFLGSLGVFTNDCTLEVSSPGLDRVLRNEQDFTRFEGSLVQVSLRIEGRRLSVRGRLQGLRDGMVIVIPSESPRDVESIRGIRREGESLLLPASAVAAVRLEPEV